MRTSNRPKIVHHRIKLQAYPFIHCENQCWKVVGCDLPYNALNTMDILSDLANYGMVLPLAEVMPGYFLWWKNHPEPESNGLIVDVARTQKEKIPQGLINCIRWTNLPDIEDKWRYRISSAACCFSANNGLPLVNHELLTIIAGIDDLPKGDIYLTLSAFNYDDFQWLWNEDSRKSIRIKTTLLLERRRLALGLPVNYDKNLLKKAIYRHFFLPTVQSQLDDVNTDKERFMHCVTQEDIQKSGAKTQLLDFQVGRFLSYDPLGENIYVLGGRRIKAKTPIAQQMRCTGRRLVKLAQRNQLESIKKQTDIPYEFGAAVLAAIQLDYLQSE